MSGRFIEGFRLSPQQKHLWLLQQVDQSPSYRAQCAILIEGNVDTGILKAALRNVWDRHEILRTAFQCLPGIDGPFQVMTDGGVLSVDSYNLTGWDSPRQEARIAALCQKANETPLDFEQGRISQVSLITLSPTRHTLLVSLSSLCADSISLNNLMREICDAYSAYLRHEELADQPAQYADLAEWQNELLESEDTKTGRDYWRRQDFADLPAFKLPYEGQSPIKPGFRPLFVASTIDSGSLAKVRTLTRKYDASACAFLLACWQILLWRLVGESDFVVGMACDGRAYEELQKTLGLFSKHLPLRCHLEGKLQFCEILRRVDESACEALQWQEYFSWEHVAGSNGNLPATPFCAAGFEFREQTVKYSAADLTFSIRKQLVYADRFKVKLSCFQKEDLVVAQFHYDSSLFRAEDIKRLNEQFHKLLESAVRNPEAAINELEILSTAQRQQLLAEFNATETDFPEDKLIHQLFEEQVERTPDSVAVAFEQQQLSYAQLNARANQLAHHLQALGVSSDVPVAICMTRCPEMVVGLLGILKAGGAYLPLDPAYPKERLAFMLEDAPGASAADAIACRGKYARSSSAPPMPGLRMGGHRTRE